MIADCACGHDHNRNPTHPCANPACGCHTYRPGRVVLSEEIVMSELEDVETSTPTPVVDQEVVVSSLEFGPDGVQVAYMVMPDDVRADGRLVSSHMMAISDLHPEVGDDVVLLREAAERLVKNALVEWPDAEIVVPDADDEDEDDDEGMGG